MWGGQAREILQMKMKMITFLSQYTTCEEDKRFSNFGQSFKNISFVIGDEIAKINGGNLGRARRKWGKWKFCWKYRSKFPFLQKFYECNMRIKGFILLFFSFYECNVSVCFVNAMWKNEDLKNLSLFSSIEKGQK